MWSASYPGNAASVRTGIASSLGTVARGSGVRWILVDILRSPHDELVSALSWNPDGRYPNCLAGKLLICHFMLFLFSFPILSCETSETLNMAYIGRLMMLYMLYYFYNT